jgi:phosphinothricin acetyltransferase
MQVRAAHPDDAAEFQAIYAPIVRDTCISFETTPPTIDDMRARIAAQPPALPWLTALDDAGAVIGYVYANKHRERAAYQWSVDVTAYVRADSRGRGVARTLYRRLFARLEEAGYCQAFAGIALPNAASVALHEAMGFEPIGLYRNVGFKQGAWHDVQWWQKSLQLPADPRPPG